MTFVFKQENSTSGYAILANPTSSTRMRVTSRFDATGRLSHSEQQSKLDALIEGRDACLTLDTCNGMSQTYLKDKTFYISGGQHGPPFGGDMLMSMDYKSNKDEILKFLTFLASSDPDSD